VPARQLSAFHWQIADNFTLSENGLGHVREPHRGKYYQGQYYVHIRPRLLIDMRAIRFLPHCCRNFLGKKKEERERGKVIIQNSTVLLVGLKAKPDERPAFKHRKKVLLLSRLGNDGGGGNGRGGGWPVSFSFKTRGWLYLDSPVDSPISETRYTTFYRYGFIRPSPR